MDGSLRGRRAQGTPQQSVHASYIEPGEEVWSGSEWSWTWTSESWSSDWSADPWSRHLDQHRPGWRRDRKPENWDDLSPRPQGQRQWWTKRVEDIPLPRLLGRPLWSEGVPAREADSPEEHRPGRPPALRLDSPHQPRQGKVEPRAREPDSPEGHDRDGARAGRPGVDPARPGPAALRLDSAHGPGLR